MNEKKFDLNEMLSARQNELADTGNRELAGMVHSFHDELVNKGMSRNEATVLASQYVMALVTALAGKGKKP